MTDTRIRHVYDCDEETFWRELFFDADFYQRLYVDHLGFRRWELLRDDDGERERQREVRLLLLPPELPAAVAKVLGDDLGYLEKGVFDKQRRRYTTDIIPNRMADKVRIRAEIYVEPREEGRCERFVDLSVDVKIFGVGRRVENRIIKDTVDAYERAFDHEQKYLAERNR